MKLESWLRLTGIPYTLAPRAAWDKAPKGQIPFIEYDGRLIGDSTLIIAELEAREGKSLDTHLTPAERAISLVFRRMLKEHAFWYIIELRFRMAENWAHYRAALAQIVAPGQPEAQWGPMVEQIREMMLGRMHGQGMGRHRHEEICALARADFTALSDFLGDKPYFLGDRPATLDATAYAYLANIILVPYRGAIVDHAASLGNLRQYLDRMSRQLFPELVGQA